jgi:hypothetical protein
MIAVNRTGDWSFGYSILRRLGPVLALAALFLTRATARADGPRDRLLSLVPPEMEVCLVVTDLRDHARHVAEADWFKALWQSPLSGIVAKAPEVKKLLQVEQDLRKHFQVDFALLRDDLVGDAVAFAYRSGPPGNPESERGLFLLWARDPGLLERLLDSLNQEQKKTGVLRDLQVRIYKSLKYVERSEKERPHFYFRDGPLLAFSSDEGLLKRVIDRHVSAAPAAPHLAEAFEAWPAKKALAALWINPRMLDAELATKATKAEGSEAAVLKHLLVYWKALDAVVVTLGVRPDLEVSLALRARGEKLPAPWRRLMAEANRPGALWDLFPGKPLLAVVGRVDAKALTDSLSEFMTPEARKGFIEAVGRVLSAPLGLDVFEEVLPHLGPEWGAFVGAPASGEDFPQILLALQVRPGSLDSPVDQALLKGLHSAAMLAVLSYNSTHPDQVRLRTAKQGAVEVRYLTNERTFPKGLRPAFTLKEGFLVIASSPEVIRTFAAVPTGPKASSGEKPILRMTLTEWAKALKSQREPWIQAMTAEGKMNREAAEKLADGLLLVLRQFDYLELNQQVQKGQVAWTVRLRPLQK